MLQSVQQILLPATSAISASSNIALKYLFSVFKFIVRLPLILKIKSSSSLFPNNSSILSKYCPFLHCNVLPFRTLLVAARTPILASFTVLPSLSLCISTRISFRLNCFCSPTRNPLFVTTSTNICVSFRQVNSTSFLQFFSLHSFYIVFINSLYSSFVSVCFLTVSSFSLSFFNFLKSNPSMFASSSFFSHLIMLLIVTCSLSIVNKLTLPSVLSYLHS